MFSASLHIKIQSPEGPVWEGRADSISSENVHGPFDVLPQHARFITVIQKKDIFVREGKELKTFNFPRALMFVRDDQVSIYTGL